MLTGKTPWNKGRKGLQVAWNKGISLPEEQREAVRMAQTGKIVSAELRAKISATLKGRMPSVNLQRESAKISASK